MSLPPLPPAAVDEHNLQGGRLLYTQNQTQTYGKDCRASLIKLVEAVHRAKGRYHSQIAMCDLYDACGLPNTRPVKGGQL